jgi:hypothetical protein
MLKRRIAVLVAGVFIGTQAGMAADEQDNSFAVESDQYVASEPTQEAPASDQYVATEATQEEPAPFAIAEVSPPVAATVNPVVANQPSVVTNLITVTVARSDAFPPSADDMVWTLLPRQAKYLDERAVRIQTAVRSDAFPPSADDVNWTPLPGQAKYFEQRAARIQTAVRGDTFPPSADDIALKLLPSQVSYFDQKAARTNVSMDGNRSSDLTTQ